MGGLLLTAHGEPFAEQLAIRHWQIEDGLPQNSANCVLQTHDGYIWVATYSGLARFDGRSFTVFGRESEPQLASERVTALFEDENHILWVGCETGELFRYVSGRFESQGIPKTWVSTKIAWISSDENHDLWILDRYGWLVRVRDGLAYSPPVVGDLSRITNCLVKDLVVGGLWALRTGILGRVEEGIWRVVDLPASISGQPVQAIGAARTGGIWLLAQGKLFRLNNEQWSEPSAEGTWAQGSVTSICELDDGKLAFGTLEKGLFISQPGWPTLQFGRGHRVGDNWIQSLTVDREGSLWIGTALAGVSVLQRTNYNKIVPPEIFGVHSLKTVSVRGKGGIWVGTEGGGLYCFSNGEWTVFGNSAGLTNPYVWTVLEDHAGRTWVGTWGGGIFELKDGRFERFSGLEDPREQAAALLEAKDGSMWIGTVHGLIHYLNGKVERYGVAQGISSPEVRCLAEDANGGIWFGMAGGGLGSLVDGRLRLYGAADGLAGNYIVSLFFDNDGALWIGSTSGGITRFKDGRFIRIGRESGFPGSSVGHLSDDGEGNFWISSDHGIFRISQVKLNAVAEGGRRPLIYERFGGGEGMERIENSAGCRTPDGVLWYPAGQSLVRIDPRRKAPPVASPKTVLEQFTVDGHLIAQGVEAGATVRVPEIGPGRERFVFRFTAPIFVQPERLRFRYRLFGLDDDWIDAGSEHSASYHRIPPGHYRFAVMAMDGERPALSSPVQLSFIVQPWFWERWWVRLLGYASAGLAIAGLAVLQQRRSQRRKTERLHRQQALERERTRIARDIHDDLGASLTRISLLSQSARREMSDPEKSALRIDNIYSTAHELTHKMDEIVWAVNPRHDSLESVVDYFANFAQELLGAAGIGCRLEMPPQMPAKPVFAGARHHLFLAFKEALNNVVKHADSTCVTISLSATEAELILRIHDDGRGLGERGLLAGQGNGLINMRQRMTEAGGRCEVGALSPRGTVVTFYLPLRNSPDAS